MYEKIVDASLISDEAFQQTLKKTLSMLRIDIRRVSHVSGISESTLYKLVSGARSNPRISTFRRIVNAIRKLEGLEGGEPFIAVIASRQSLDALKTAFFKVGERRFRIKEYPVSSVEDVIVAAVRAQSEGAKGLVCAPIVSTTVEKIVNIPVTTCPVGACRAPFLSAIEALTYKIIE
jgi:predicted transcriptional regulator